jgi:hypothetical protein
MSIKEKAKKGDPQAIAYLSNLKSDIKRKIEKLEEKKNDASNYTLEEGINKLSSKKFPNRSFIINDYVSIKTCFEPIDRDLMRLREMLSELQELFFEAGIDW